MSEIRVDNITDEAGTGSPSLPNGLVTPSATVSGDIDLGGALTNGGPAGIQIDSAGRVNMPNQPAFYAQHPNDGSNSQFNAGEIVQFKQVHFNRGNNYDPSNSRFTAPIDGIYCFNFQVLGDAADNDRQIFYVRINGSIDFQNLQIAETSGTTKDFNSVGSMVLFLLSAGDYVDIESNGGNMFSGSSGQNYFLGYLVS